MKRHTCHRHMSKEMAAVLRQSKHNLPKGTTGHGIAPESVIALVASGKITREVSCDGKSRFRTYDYAEKVRPILEERYDQKYVVYACVFCDGFHVATEKEFAA